MLEIAKKLMIKSFFTSHDQFQCWLKQSGSEQSLYLAILPMFESSDEKRRNVIQKNYFSIQTAL